jgi:uncharacterized surface anchored protein
MTWIGLAVALLSIGQAWGPAAAPGGSAVLAASTTGTLVVQTVDVNGDELHRTCFWLFTNAGGGVRGGFVTGFCSDDNGRSQANGLAPGSYLLDQIRSRPGYISSSQRIVAITAGKTTRLTLTNKGSGSTISVKKLDPDGNRLKDACFQVYKGQISNSSSIVAAACDGEDGKNDGSIHLYGAGSGSYSLYEARSPVGYFIRSSTTSLNIPSGGKTFSITVTNFPVDDPDNVVVTKKDQGSTVLPGACFAIFKNLGNGQFSGFVANACDGNDGAYDGKTIIGNIPPGSYVLQESRSPAGYQLGLGVAFTKAAGTVKKLTVHDKPGGTKLLVKAVDTNTLKALPGACWQVHVDNGSGGLGNFVTGGCDGSDGYGPNDGTFQVLGLPAGNYVLYQGTPPAGYKQASKRSFTITTGQAPKTITVKFKPTTGASSAEVQSAETTPTAPATVTPSPATPIATATTEPTTEPTVEPTETQTTEPTPTTESAPTEESLPTEEQSPTATEESDLPSTDGTPEATS